MSRDGPCSSPGWTPAGYRPVPSLLGSPLTPYLFSMTYSDLLLQSLPLPRAVFRVLTMAAASPILVWEWAGVRHNLRHKHC
jgi:hypothetical protein